MNTFTLGTSISRADPPGPPTGTPGGCGRRVITQTRPAVGTRLFSASRYGAPAPRPAELLRQAGKLAAAKKKYVGLCQKSKCDTRTLSGVPARKNSKNASGLCVLRGKKRVFYDLVAAEKRMPSTAVTLVVALVTAIAPRGPLFPGTLPRNPFSLIIIHFLQAGAQSVSLTTVLTPECI